MKWFKRFHLGILKSLLMKMMNGLDRESFGDFGYDSNEISEKAIQHAFRIC